jgi:signal transduction histidine kinase
MECRLNEVIETGNRRGEFFSNMAHELKTPLSVILGAVQLMEKGGSEQSRNDRMEKNLNTVKYNCYRLLRLTNNLLDLARSESGYLALKLVNCELNTLIDEIVQSVRPFAEKKQLELSCLKAAKPISIALDIEKIERIMLNLLSNAIKFSNPGGAITISTSESDGRAYISVKDTGAGIPADMQREIFVRYKQSGQCPNIENEGSGIGLSLVKTFVELHHGNIKLISEINKGSEFIIDLPLVTAEMNGDFKNLNDLDHAADEAAKVEFSGMYSITT